MSVKHKKMKTNTIRTVVVLCAANGPEANASFLNPGPDHVHLVSLTLFQNTKKLTTLQV